MAEIEKSAQNISPEKEIKELERRLEQKKRELAAGAAAPAEGASAEGMPAEKSPEDKELLRDVLRERIGEHQPVSAPAPSEPGLVPQLSRTPASGAPAKTDDDKISATREEELKSLVDFALSRGISGAIEKARTESPYLLDALHDRLTDEYYEKMLALGKIKPL